VTLPSATRRDSGLRKIYYAALTYMILGLISGLVYREVTKAKDFTGQTQLGLVHAHLLTLGMLFFLLVLVLEKLFTLTASTLFGWFFWTYNAGLAVTVGMMVTHGTMTVYGKEFSDALAGVAGLGHIILTVGLVLFFIVLGKRVPADSSPGAGPAGTPEQ
jgi:hypothetical protein